MKRRTKKVQAKIDLLKLAEQHAFLIEYDKVIKILETIGDENLELVVKAFMQAKVELELYLDILKTEVAPHLPDDSDF